MLDALSKSMLIKRALCTISFSNKDLSINLSPSRHFSITEVKNLFQLRPNCTISWVWLFSHFYTNHKFHLQNSKMLRHSWSARYTCCSIIERNRMSPPMRNRNSPKCSWRPTHTRTSSGNSRTKKPSRPFEGEHSQFMVIFSHRSNIICWFLFFSSVCWCRKSCTNSSWRLWGIFVRKHRKRPKHLFHRLMADASKTKNWDKFWKTLAPNARFNTNKIRKSSWPTYSINLIEEQNRLFIM